MTGVLTQFKSIDKNDGDPNIAEICRSKMLGVQDRSNLSGKSDVVPKTNQLVYKSDGGPKINWLIKTHGDPKTD